MDPLGHRAPSKGLAEAFYRVLDLFAREEAENLIFKNLRRI